MDKIQKVLAKKKAEPIETALASKHLLHYARWMYKEFYEVEFLESWYHGYLCEALMAVFRGELTRLIITIPPSYGKTDFAVKFFISWALGQISSLKAIYVSYSDDLAGKTPANVKQMIKSTAYKKVFGEKKLNKTADKEWYLDKDGMEGGGMFSTTVRGGVTGFHGDFLIIDDPMKAIEANSKSARDEVVEFFEGSASSRLRKSNPNAAIIVIMQRLHEKDLVGHLLETQPEEWTHINLTGIEPIKKVYEFMNFYYERPANEPLNERMESREKLEKQKKTMNEKWYSQYMQDPKTIETGYVKDEDFTTIASWELTADNKCISIDPAQSTKETADNRSISVVGSLLSPEKLELFNVYGTWFGKWTMDEFCDHIINLMIEYYGIPVFIESSGGGILIEQYLKKKIAQVNFELKQKGQPILYASLVKLFNPKTKISKNQKIDLSIDALKNHQIRFLVGAPGVEQVKKEYKAFHPERDSKEDDCMETIANVVVNNFVVPKKIDKEKTINIDKNDIRAHGVYKKRRGWRV